nr:uncharacterized protein LOC120969136 [Aegilops tauschii subsp. strangulata]
MTDAWTDKKGRGVMNLVVHSSQGVIFLNSVDCSSVQKNGKYIFDLVDNCIEDIGADKVVQVVTDNASVNVAAASLMKAKRPSIFWNGCAAHCIDPMLEDIGKLGSVDRIIVQARQVTVFLYAHTRVLALMRKTLGKDLVRSGVTRFATAYLNLKSLQDNKKEMLKLFRSDELHEMGYLEKDKGKMAHKTVQSEAFWKGVGVAVNYFEPMANVLRRMDSDVPAMGFLYGCMLDAKKEIAASFDNDESRFKCVIDIIDKRWDNKLKSPLHLAGYFLNPYYYYPNKVVIERDGSFRAAVVHCITRMIEDQKTQDELIDELDKYEAEEDSFGMDIAVRQRKRKNFSPAKWWLNYGTCAPLLKDLAMKILSLTCSSSACERNWSAFEQVHTKKRSRLLHDRMSDLVFIKFNSRMKHKRENKSRDPIEKTIVDVLEDEDNEFITGIVGNDNVVEHVGDEDQTQQERASTSQEQGKKKKRPTAPPRKKRKKSLQSLLNSVDEEAILSASSNSSSSESEDESPSALADSD